MPASIVLSQITWSTPDGRTLLDHLDFRFAAERTGLIGRNGVGKTTLFNIIAGLTAPASGSVVITGSIGLLRQDLILQAGETVADLFGARPALALLDVAEAGAATVEQLADIDWTLRERLTGTLDRFGLGWALDARLSTLSGGQRTRAALAALTFNKPDFLLLDEPTNNLDEEGRRLVIDLLASWRGGAIVISHDRALLAEVDAIVELTTLGATRYGGNWSHYRACRAVELSAATHDLAIAQRQMDELARATQATAERQARRDGAGRRKRAKGDAPRILLDAKKDRSEATGGAHARLAEARHGQATEALSAARKRVEVLQPLSMQIASTNLLSGRVVLRLEGVSAGYAGGSPVISDMSLDVTGPERIAITGANGAGKTTLLSVMSGRLASSEGTVQRPVGFAVLDQTVSLLDGAATIRDNFRRLNPNSGEEAARAALARFMFRADAAMQVVSSLSGGQRLRAGLACTLGGDHPPPLLFLDEPTNHLDIESIEALEAALARYDGALIVISHDRAFLEAIGITRVIAL